jgi:hypothetical protein
MPGQARQDKMDLKDVSCRIQSGISGFFITPCVQDKKPEMPGQGLFPEWVTRHGHLFFIHELNSTNE